MPSLISHNSRIRKNYAKLKAVIDLPSLIEIQRDSFANFLQADKLPDKREDIGIQGVFKSVFPIEDFDRTASLEYEKYILERPKYSVDECRQRGMTFAAPITVTVRLVVWDVDEETETRSIRDIKEQDVYLGEIPLMTETGSFIINGTERVVVSQLHRSPGVFFDHDQGKTHSSGKLLYSARIIPYRGSWIDFEFDHKDLIYVRIDRRRKMLATVLLKALGYSVQELLDYFYNRQTITIDGKKLGASLELDLMEGLRASVDIKHPKTKKVVIKKNRKLTAKVIDELKKSGVTHLEITEQELIGKVSATDLAHPKTGELLLEVNERITPDKIEKIIASGVKTFDILYIDNLNVGPYLSDTLVTDKVQTQDEAMIEIYRRLRPGDPPTLDTARNFFENLFFNPARYDLSKVGRLKLNHKFDLDTPLDMAVLTKKDVMEVVRYLIDLKNGKGRIDDIDHLGNRRVRCVGELLENQYRIGLVRMERAIKERMSLQDVETLMPHDLINAKPISAVVKEFFGSSQLSQFMDQTNPLSEVTHKRRLSALGPGGLTRDRAGFEVRDVHSTHYGRICPIETPEGPNIGLISSLTTYARVNPYGFIETPYREVKEGRVSDRVEYLSALQEEKHAIAQANAPLTNKKEFENETVSARRRGEFQIVPSTEVDLMDVSPEQLVSVAAALIPFLQNDDANRALMGSNMQRQAVPLLKAKAPLVGTGMEAVVARDSGVTVVAKKDGIVEHVDANRVVVRSKKVSASGAPEVEIYHLIKYRQSNQNTCINQIPIVRRGDEVKAGQVLADGPATELGELALGQNVLVAFMPWGGYNFEDSILVSERFMREDIFTSIHIESFECIARDTKLGKEEITRDIPNVGEEALRNLDESGIIRIGAEVKPSDILVGKVTPKGETQLSPEEKLLRAIFGEKAGDVRDTSLRVPSGVVGTIIDAQIFSREGTEKDERAKQIQEEEINRLLKDQAAEINIIKRTAMDRLSSLITGATTTGKLLSEDGNEVLLKKGDKITSEIIGSIPFDLVAHIPLETKLEQDVSQIVKTINDQIDVVKMLFQERIHKLKQGDELPPGVIKMVKVYVAIKRKLQVGDKMAGRHGNKGVVSRALPIEDMPYLADGTAVDIVLNPLGVPSRMNVGQILETHLGWAAKGIGEQINSLLSQWRPDELKKYIKKVYSSTVIDKLIDNASEKELKTIAYNLRGGVHVSTPVFDGASESEIRDFLTIAELPTKGQATLFDGRSGEAFDHDVTVGQIYMMKLHHLVEDKIHARSIGPYSLVTQQPLGGKAQFGGQRLGEMEVWALEAYGAAYALQEFLTVKSDDVIGRTRIYESIVKGENILEPGLPESFNVLIKELQALSLDIRLVESPTE